MVVPDSASVVPQRDSGVPTGLSESLENESSEAGEGEQDLAGVELEEVRKLQELVRRLEVQNETLRSRGGKTIIHRGADSNHTEALNIEHLTQDNAFTSNLAPEPSVPLGCADLKLSALQERTSEEMSPLPVADRLEEEEDEEGEDHGPCGGFLTFTQSNGANGASLGQSQTPESPSQESYESETLAESDSGVEQSALDEVDILNLEDDCAEVEDEDSWLYVSPKKQVADGGSDSPLKWCRQALDHRSPETEMACRTLMSRLDTTSRWRNMYSSPSEAVSAGSAGSGLISPGYHKSTNKSLLTCGSSGAPSMHPALSSQSSIDSELSTSDDSISMGYKLQDLTDVQIMARLQEESLRQDYASSSASASRRSSTASLQSLRRGGTYSDQEFDTYSLEDEEDGSTLPQRRNRFTPSPLGSPRCLSPSTSSHGQDYSGRLGAPCTRAPRRSLQGPSAELLKFAKSEEELRHSMPNLAPRTSLRSLEAVRNSRSMEANLQSSGNRMSHLTPSSSSSVATCSRLRTNGQSPLSLRTPVKAMTTVSSMSVGRQASRGLPVIQGRRVQSQGPANGGPHIPGRASTGTGRPGALTSASTRSKVSQSPRRSLGLTKIADDSWKDGCY